MDEKPGEAAGGAVESAAPLDRIDRAILRLISRDATLPLAAIAREVGLSATPCWKRIKRMEEAGVITGRVAKLSPERLGYPVSVFVSVETADHSAAWLARFGEVIAEMKKYKNMTIVATEYDDDSPTKAFTQAQLLLLKYPHLKGIFATNVFSGEGVGKAVVSSGKKGRVDVVGYDAEPQEVKLLKQGVITTLIMQRPAEEGRLAVEYAHDILTGHASKVPASKELANVVATTKTASNPDVAKYFYKTNLVK